MKKIEHRVVIPGRIDGTYYDSDFRHRIITQVAERRQKHQAVSMDTHYEEFYHYKKFNDTSARCPCWRSTDPNPKCPLCYGQGWLPPYQRLGFVTHCVLTSDSVVQALNGYVKYNSDLPVPAWYIRDGAYNMRLESEYISLSQYAGVDVDLWTSLAPEDEKWFTYEFQIEGDSEWYSIEDLTSKMQTQSLRLKLRVTAARESFDEQIPGFTCLYLRYRVDGCKNVQGTMPQWALSRERATAGILDLIDSAQLIVKGQGLTKVEVGDFFHMISTGKRWRVTGIDSETVNGVIMEWALQVRKVIEQELAFAVV